MVYLENINLNKQTINIWCNSEKKYHLFLSKSQLPNIFYFKNQTIVPLKLFNLDTVNLKIWTPDQHYLFEKILGKHRQITYQDNRQKWLEISKEVPNTSPKECLQHYQFIKQQLQENRKKKEQAITLDQPVYQTQFQTKNESTDLYLIDIIFPTMIEIQTDAKIILYNFDSLLLEYKIPVEKIYLRIHQLITKHSLNIDNIWFASENLETLFNLDDFAMLYQHNFKLNKNVMRKKLWGDHYYSSDKKWITRSEKIPRAFCQYVLNPILQLHDAVTNKKVKKIDKMLTKLNILPEDKFNFNNIFHIWFPVSQKTSEVILDIIH